MEKFDGQRNSEKDSVGTYPQKPQLPLQRTISELPSEDSARVKIANFDRDSEILAPKNYQCSKNQIRRHMNSEKRQYARRAGEHGAEAETTAGFGGAAGAGESDSKPPLPVLVPAAAESPAVAAESDMTAFVALAAAGFGSLSNSPDELERCRKRRSSDAGGMSASASADKDEDDDGDDTEVAGVPSAAGEPAVVAVP